MEDNTRIFGTRSGRWRRPSQIATISSLRDSNKETPSERSPRDSESQREQPRSESTGLEGSSEMPYNYDNLAQWGGIWGTATGTSTTTNYWNNAPGARIETDDPQKLAAEIAAAKRFREIYQRIIAEQQAAQEAYFQRQVKRAEELVLLEAAAKIQDEIDDKEEGEVVNKFVIGCDPEFVALDQRGAVVNVAHNLTPDGEVGYDHNGRVVELRPRPAKGTYALVRRIKTLLESDQAQRINAAKFRAGACVLAGGNRVVLGGHFHYDLDPYTEAGNLTAAHNTRLVALDKATRLLELLDILPKDESDVRRKSTEYGKFGAYRIPANREGKRHTEYRTMASWLYDPRVAFTCLTAAKLAAAEPDATIEELEGATSFLRLAKWVTLFKTKDQNARRLLERVFSKGHKSLVVQPDADFRENWRELEL